MRITTEGRREERGSGRRWRFIGPKGEILSDFRIGNKTNKRNTDVALRTTESTCGFTITNDMNARSFIFAANRCCQKSGRLEIGFETQLVRMQMDVKRSEETGLWVCGDALTVLKGMSQQGQMYVNKPREGR